ncbi:MAG: fibronectin type III domain-containing protein [Candidatus Marinimicrobia bacterium]|nr:fibronectin type III domain-containing protein [Candidatus Neomarinimicrobiota bacterium]
MKFYSRIAGILLLASLSFLYGIALPNFTQNEIMHEQTRSFLWGGDVNVHINAPGEDSLKLDKETIIIFYALPAGNTIEWTIGKLMEEGNDWHYDIQHIGAQTRFVRNTLKDKNIITIYVQPISNSWVLWAQSHPNDYIEKTQQMTDNILEPFSEFNYKVTLNSHSAGGGWIFRNIYGRTKIPSWIDRIGFIDSNYNYRYNADIYDPLFKQFLNQRDSTYLCFLVYNDSTALLSGEHFIGIGGTWCTAKLMKSRLDPYFTFIDSHDVSFYRYTALNKRFEILMKKNPTQAILHTVQVYRNGFIHTMLSGTEYENVGYQYYGEPAYLEYIQGNPPQRPEGVGVAPAGNGTIKIDILPPVDATAYRIYFSEDGITYTDTVTINSCQAVLSGLTNNKTNYIRISAINNWGESEKSELLAVLPGLNAKSLLLVNGQNRTAGHNYLFRHGNAAKAYAVNLASCTNNMIVNGQLSLDDFDMVDYVVSNEGRVDYTLTQDEIDLIKSYLQQGGNLFISGLELAYDLDIKGDSVKQTFCHDFLKFRGISDNPNNLRSTYYDASFSGFDFFDTTLTFSFDDGSNGTYNVGDPDGIQPINGSYRSVIFTGYDPSISCGGIAYSGDFPDGTAPGKVFVMTIPFETIVGDTVRSIVMGEILDFLQNCGVGIESVSIPQTTTLNAVYPNPFNPRTAVSYSIFATPNSIGGTGKQLLTDLSIYNLMGQKIKTLYNGSQEIGTYRMYWNAADQPSGVYLAVLKVDGAVMGTQKMVLLK